MKKWEYQVVNVTIAFKPLAGSERKLQSKCEELGKEGWELVNFQNYDKGAKVMLIFKREVE